MTPHRITITLSLDSEGKPRHNRRGPLYDAAYQGQVIVTATTEPLLVDGARALKAMGLTGRLEMWDHERPYPRMRAGIDKAAGVTVREGEGRPRFVRFDSFAPRSAPRGDFRTFDTEVAPAPERPLVGIPVASVDHPS